MPKSPNSKNRNPRGSNNSPNNCVVGLRQQVDRFLSDYAHARRSVADERRRLKQADVELCDAEQAQQLLQSVAKWTQEAAHCQISGIVSRCLQVVFGKDAYQFRILFERKRGKTEARLVFERDGAVFDRPLEQVGGGVTDVAAFALRVAELALTRPNRRRLLILDEPFKFVDPSRRPRIRELVESLAEELGIQFILVSHDPEFQIGKLIELK